MNFNVLYPWAYNVSVSLVFYLDKTHMFPRNDFGFYLKNRMTGQEFKFVPAFTKSNNRKLRLQFEITNDPLQADPETGIIYINQDGYWDYELYYSLVSFWDATSSQIYPVEKGSIFFYRSVDNPEFPSSDDQPEVVYISPESKGYNMNENFTASVLNTNPVL